MNGSLLKQMLEKDPNLVPLLEHEHSYLVRAMGDLMLRNSQAAETMEFAVQDGNGWHDNSGYDAALAEMEQVDNISKILGSVIEHAEVIPYPSAEEAGVTLGSCVELDDGIEPYIIRLTGQNYFTPREETQAEEIDVTSVRSPLGLALLGAKPGDIIRFALPSGDESELTIRSVRQMAAPSPGTEN